MLFRKNVFFCFLFYLFCLPAFSQEDGARLRIQQLKQQLPLLEGLAKAHCLNQIAYYCIESAYVTSDSGLVYAREAMAFAGKINDNKDLCIAINLYAKVLLQLSRPDEGLVYYRRLFHLAGENGYDSLATLGIRGMGQALWYQGNFQKAIDTIELSIQYFQRRGDIRSISDATMIMSNIYGDQGNYEKAFVVAQEAFTMSLGLHDTDNIVLSLSQLGELYENIGDYGTALEYYKKAYGFGPHVGYWSHRHLSNCMGDLYCKLQQYDSAYYFYGQSFIGNRGSKTSRWKTGEYYLAREQYDTALLFFRKLYDDLKEGGEGHIFMYAMLGLGNVYLAKKDFAKALYYGNKVLALAREKNARLNIRNACQLLYGVYEASKQPGRALDYYKEYVAMKDSVITDQFKGRLYAFKRNAEDEKKLAQIKLLEKEKTISDQKLKGNQLLRQSTFSLIFRLTVRIKN